MVVSSFAKFVTPGRVSFVTFWALRVAPPTPRTRAMSSAFRFSMMGAMVSQPRHDAPSSTCGVRLPTSFFELRRTGQADLDDRDAAGGGRVRAPAREARHRRANCDDRPADCGDGHDEGGLGGTPGSARRQDTRPIAPVRRNPARFPNLHEHAGRGTR